MTKSEAVDSIFGSRTAEGSGKGSWGLRDWGREDGDLGDGPTPGDRRLYQMIAMRSGEKEREREGGWREGAYEIQGKGRDMCPRRKTGAQEKTWDPRIQGSQWGLEKGASGVLGSQASEGGVRASGPGGLLGREKVSKSAGCGQTELLCTRM